jgi:hypothetical protein
MGNRSESALRNFSERNIVPNPTPHMSLQHRHVQEQQRAATSRCSSGLCGVATSRSSTGSCCPGKSKCSSGPCGFDISRCSKGLYSVDTSRCSSGFFVHTVQFFFNKFVINLLYFLLSGASGYDHEVLDIREFRTQKCTEFREISS